MSNDDDFNPSEWRVRGQLRHGGVIYGPGEPLPVLTLGEALRYEEQGFLIRLVGGEGRQSLVTLLRSVDHIVLQSVVAQKLSPAQVRDLAQLAKESGRSRVLQLALDGMAYYAGLSEAKQHA